MHSLKAMVPWEREFLQAVNELLNSIAPVLKQDPLYENFQVLERLVIPERIISFRVVWTDDQNKIRVNNGYRVQFNSAIGPYKGGTRFHASVNLSSLKFLGFEQIFKNALTGLPMGGGKGGSDFSVTGKSRGEIMRFCHSYMTELFRYIGPDIDVPAGDIGVGAQEIGFLFGAYKRLSGRWNCSLTGKGLSWGGSQLRPEATGYGIVYFAENVLQTKNENLEGKKVAVSGFGNVAWGVVKKATELGARVVTLSGPDGFIHDPDGVSGEKIDFMKTMRFSGIDEVKQYSDQFGVEFIPNKRPWIIPCDIAFPCAIQNELDLDDAKALIRNGCKFVIEGANMPTTLDAVHLFHDAGIIFVPGKASNAGGVGASGLEIVQNKNGFSWDAQKVDDQLHRIMSDIHEICITAAEKYGRPDNYVVGANIGGFLKVAEAMIDHGAV
ncbi:MAG: NADP-specific glutamate dehydrogenase [Desulfobacterales bacterium]|nr:NADP-specific glutamate dehydrogenase [Desulfobacterales bacterium]